MSRPTPSMIRQLTHSSPTGTLRPLRMLTPARNGLHVPRTLKPPLSNWPVTKRSLQGQWGRAVLGVLLKLPQPLWAFLADFQVLQFVEAVRDGVCSALQRRGILMSRLGGLLELMRERGKATMEIVMAWLREGRFCRKPHRGMARACDAIGSKVPSRWKDFGPFDAWE